MLPELCVAVLFGQVDPPAELQAALLFRGREIVDDGYRRASLPRGEWTVEGAAASKVAAFGPFHMPAAFDAVCIHNGDDVLDETLIGADVRVAPGMVYLHDVEVKFR